MAVASLLVLVWTTNFTVIVIGNPSCIVSLLCVCVFFLSFVQDDPVCIAARRDGKTLVTESWVEDSLDIGKVADAKRVGSNCSLFFFISLLYYHFSWKTLSLLFPHKPYNFCPNFVLTAQLFCLYGRSENKNGNSDFVLG